MVFHFDPHPYVWWLSQRPSDAGDGRPLTAKSIKLAGGEVPKENRRMTTLKIPLGDPDWDVDVDNWWVVSNMTFIFHFIYGITLPIDYI